MELCSKRYFVSGVVVEVGGPLSSDEGGLSHFSKSNVATNNFVTSSSNFQLKRLKDKKTTTRQKDNKKAKKTTKRQKATLLHPTSQPMTLSTPAATSN